MKLSLRSAFLGAALLAAAGTVAQAQIRELNLRQMVEYADSGVVGTIESKEVIRVDHPIDGPELYYTFLTVEGTDLETGTSKTVEVAFWGGFIDDENGVFNSEAPSADDTEIGNEIVAFYRWSDMGGDVTANALVASHGGLYRTYRNKGRMIIQGRGEGYAIETNIERESLRSRVREIKRR